MFILCTLSAQQNIFDKINSYVPQNREYFIDIKKKDGSKETKYFKYEKYGYKT